MRDNMNLNGRFHVGQSVRAEVYAIHFQPFIQHVGKRPSFGVGSESYCAVIEAQTDPNSGNHANSWNSAIIEDSQGNAYQRLPVQNQQINVFYHVYDNSPDGVTIFANWKESESAYELGTFSDPVSGTSIGG